MSVTADGFRPSYVHLDMARGLAALAVLAGHLRSFVFPSYEKLATHGPLEIAVWTATGFGHQAVMVFFVLSGFFITRSIIVDDRRAGFSWPVYLIKRLTRLWVVLLPCLCLTLVWDRIGMSVSEAGFYEGRLFTMYNSGPAAITGGANLEVTTFLGNLFFLQTILTPIFGSNGPLWSLANEFWYYMMFPFLYMALAGRRKVSEVLVNIVLFASIGVFIGEGVALPGLVWLAGALCYLVHERGWARKVCNSAAALVVAGALLAAALVASKESHWSELQNDFLDGAARAVLVLVLAGREGGGTVYRKCARLLADGSYTMYLVHFPFMALLVNVLLVNRKFDPSLTGYSVFVSLGLLVLVYCYVIYWIFERRTGTIRRYLLGRYGKSASVAAKV